MSRVDIPRGIEKNNKIDHGAPNRGRLVVYRGVIFQRDIECGRVGGLAAGEEGLMEQPGTRVAFQWARRVRKSVSWIPVG